MNWNKLWRRILIFLVQYSRYWWKSDLHTHSINTGTLQISKIQCLFQGPRDQSEYCLSMCSTSLKEFFFTFPWVIPSNLHYKQINFVSFWTLSFPTSQIRNWLEFFNNLTERILPVMKIGRNNLWNTNNNDNKQSCCMEKRNHIQKQFQPMLTVNMQ